MRSSHSDHSEGVPKLLFRRRGAEENLGDSRRGVEKISSAHLSVSLCISALKPDFRCTLSAIIARRWRRLRGHGPGGRRWWYRVVGVCVRLVPRLLLVPVVPLGGVAAAITGVTAAGLRAFGTTRRVCPPPIEGDTKFAIALKVDFARNVRARVAGDDFVVRLPPRTRGEQQSRHGCAESDARPERGQVSGPISIPEAAIYQKTHGGEYQSSVHGSPPPSITSIHLGASTSM